MCNPALVRKQKNHRKEVRTMDKITNLPSNKYEKMVDFMRKDLESNMAYSRIIDKAKEIIESKGLDFKEEFSNWKNSKSKPTI